MRKPRLQYPGSLYHVIARGIRQQEVFREDGDYVRYLRLLGKHLDDRGFIIYAYALMGNHVHLLIEQAGECPLSRYMQWLLGAYSLFFNHKYRISGHLFQGRYKSILVDKDNYLLELVRYIHLNPLRAEMEVQLGTYPWTSHRQYLGKDKAPLVKVPADMILKMLSKRKIMARKVYMAYLADGIHADIKQRVYDLRGGRILGDESFEKEVYELASVGIEKPAAVSKSINEIWAAIQKRDKLKSEPIGWERSRLMAETAYVASEWAGHTRRAVADYFKITPEVISMGVRRLAERWRTGKGSREVLRKWFHGL